MTDPTIRSKRRPHAAAGGRILAAGLSVSATLVLAGAMASTEPARPTTPPTMVAAPPATSPPIIVRVVLTHGSTTGTTATTPAPAAAPSAQPATPVVKKAPVKAKATATSRGS